MSPRERQVELAKVVAGITKAVNAREIKALVVVGLRHDGQMMHGTVVTGAEYPDVLRATGEVLRRVGVEVVRQQGGETGGGENDGA